MVAVDQRILAFNSLFEMLELQFTGAEIIETCFQFSIWDAREYVRTCVVGTILSAFNSLFEMPRQAVAGLCIAQHNHFQFSIWDALLLPARLATRPLCRLSILYLRCRYGVEETQGLLRGVSFNSLFEMQFFTPPSATPPAVDFQFSIWDAAKKIKRPPVAGVIAFNSLFEMRVLRHRYAACISAVFFQFSIWDAPALGALLSAVAAWLSILYLRCVLLPGRGAPPRPLALSILYLRCAGSCRRLRCTSTARLFQFSIWDAVCVGTHGGQRYVFFQFSIWDAWRAQPVHYRASAYFQFSIWDAALRHGHSAGAAGGLSILYLRCPIDVPLLVASFFATILSILYLRCWGFLC